MAHGQASPSDPIIGRPPSPGCPMSLRAPPQGFRMTGGSTINTFSLPVMAARSTACTALAVPEPYLHNRLLAQGSFLPSFISFPQQRQSRPALTHSPRVPTRPKTTSNPHYPHHSTHTAPWRSLRSAQHCSCHACMRICPASGGLQHCSHADMVAQDASTTSTPY
jgi:hypothetical protein